MTSFDASTPAWDKEVNAVADFDAETDADGDLNDHADAAHDGAVGLEITFDDANLAFGRMNADAVDQTSGVLSFWINLNDLAIEAGKTIYLFYIRDGVPNTIYLCYLHATGALQVNYWDDASIQRGGVTTGALSSGWHKIDLMFARSSGAGNNDGWIRIYVDDALAASSSGHDNDTRDWDRVDIGMCATTSTTFGGSYYIDTIKIDPVGAPMADKLAAINGTYGMAIPKTDNTARYGEFTDPTAETEITVEFEFDPNTIIMAANDEFIIMKSSWFDVRVKYDGGYQIRSVTTTDGASETTSHYAITDGPHTIQVTWVASSGVGEDDGYLRLYIDDVLKEALTGLDNDTRTIGYVRFGGCSSLDTGTYGIFYMDDCKWSPYIGQTKFIGTMVAIDPSAGKFDDPKTSVVAQDWIGYLNNQELGLQALQSDKRADEALTTILAEFPNQPEATDFDTGVETFEVVFASDPSDSSMARMFAKLARNERGRIYSKGDGTLVFEKQGTRDGSQASAFTIDGTMSEFDVKYSSNNIYNTVALDVKTQIIDAAATQELFKVGQGIPIASLQTIILECNFTDPDTGQGVAGVDVVTPVAAPHFGTTRVPADDDMHADLDDKDYTVGATSLTVSLTNDNVVKTGYLNEFTILGKRLTDYDRITITKKNQASINQVGNSRYTNRLDLIEDPTVAEDIADGILIDYAPSHTASCRITVLANITNALAAQLIIAEPSTKFTAIESITGISKDFYIDSIRYKQDHTLLWVTIDAEEA